MGAPGSAWRWRKRSGKHRTYAGRSQDHIGEQAHCARNSISRLESGTFSPSVELMTALAAAVDVPLSTIVLRQEELIAGSLRCPRRDSVGSRCKVSPDTAANHARGHVPSDLKRWAPWAADRADHLRWGSLRRSQLLPALLHVRTPPAHPVEPVAARSGTSNSHAAAILARSVLANRQDER